MSNEKELTDILEALSALRAPAMPGEYDLHAMIGEALRGAGLSPTHERFLAPRCRIDFLVGRTGIEVKKGKPDRARLTAQLARYLESVELDRIVVVSQKMVALPKRIGGKEVVVLSLNRLWGVALP